jgi:RHS repeat-associated protein
VVEERDASGTLTAFNLYAGLDRLLLGRDYGTGATYWTQTDHLGSVESLTDAAGTVVERYSYGSFGRLSVLAPDFSPRASAPLIPFTYTGREWEPEVGMYFFRARFMDPRLGRFISQDPLGVAASGLNLQAYVDNNPVGYTDPLGLEKSDSNSASVKQLHETIIYIHGTWSNGSADTFPMSFIHTVQNYYDDPHAKFFNWSGNNRDKARREAGEQLAGMIREIRHDDPDGIVRVVAHSHGGNVALLATHHAGGTIDELITLGTPLLSDYRPGPGLKSWTQIWSPNDAVQMNPLPYLESRRTEPRARNIEVKGFSHSELHTAAAWEAAFGNN